MFRPPGLGDAASRGCSDRWPEKSRTGVNASGGYRLPGIDRAYRQVQPKRCPAAEEDDGEDGYRFGDIRYGEVVIQGYYVFIYKRWNSLAAC